MRWIIKHKPTQKFLCSKRALVYNGEFARKFNSMRQARRYISDSCFVKSECSVIEFGEDRIKESDDRKITERVYETLYRNVGK